MDHLVGLEERLERTAAAALLVVDNIDNRQRSFGILHTQRRDLGPLGNIEHTVHCNPWGCQLLVHQGFPEALDWLLRGEQEIADHRNHRHIRYFDHRNLDDRPAGSHRPSSRAAEVAVP